MTVTAGNKTGNCPLEAEIVREVDKDEGVRVGKREMRGRWARRVKLYLVRLCPHIPSLSLGL